jgi:hypothetical protein
VFPNAEAERRVFITDMLPHLSAANSTIHITENAVYSIDGSQLTGYTYDGDVLISFAVPGSNHGYTLTVVETTDTPYFIVYPQYDGIYYIYDNTGCETFTYFGNVVVYDDVLSVHDYSDGTSAGLLGLNGNWLLRVEVTHMNARDTSW